MFFDLDGTLYDRDALVHRIARDQHRAFREYFHQVDEDQFVDRLVALDDHGYVSKAQVYAQIAGEYRLGDDLVRRLEAHFWAVYDGLCRAPEGALQVLSELQRRGYKLGVITNGATSRQSAKLEALGLSSFLDAVLISETEGLRKPDRQIFHRAVERCGVMPSQAVFVGDHPDIDVAGARAAGLIAVWKRVPYWRMALDDVPTIDELGELLPICGGMQA